MANNTYKIIYYDSANTTQTTALSSLLSAGAVDAGIGVVDVFANWSNVGIADGSGFTYGDGILDGSGNYHGFGILDAIGDYHTSGIFDSGGNYYTDGCYNATTTTYYPIEALDVLGGGLA